MKIALTLVLGYCHQLHFHLFRRLFGVRAPIVPRVFRVNQRHGDKPEQKRAVVWRSTHLFTTACPGIANSWQLCRSLVGRREGGRGGGMDGDTSSKLLCVVTTLTMLCPMDL